MLSSCGSSADPVSPQASRTATSDAAASDAAPGSDAAEPEQPAPQDQLTSPDPDTGAASFSTANAQRTVRFLANRIGPREATSASYARAADWVAAQLGTYGYDVRRQSLRVPAGVSWGVPVPAGRTWNVIATSGATLWTSHI